MKFKIKINAEETEMEATRQGDRLQVVGTDGSSIELAVVKNDADGLIVNHNGRLLKIAGRKDGDKRQLWVNGRHVTYERIDETASREAADPGSLSASIPAVVSEILVSIGDSVVAGDKLILLESMKMIIPIAAPSDGTVSDLMCAVGDNVAPGIPLVSVTIDNN